MKRKSNLVELIKKYYNEGKRTNEIAKILGITEAEVVRVLEDAHLIR